MNDFIHPFDSPVRIKKLEGDLCRWIKATELFSDSRIPVQTMSIWAIGTPRWMISDPDTVKIWKRAKFLIGVQARLSYQVENWRAPIPAEMTTFDTFINYHTKMVSTEAWYNMKDQQTKNEDNLRLHARHVEEQFDRYRKILNTYDSLMKGAALNKLST